MTAMFNPLDPLGHLAHLAAGLDHPVMADFLSGLPAAPAPLRDQTPRSLPVLSWLDQAVAHAPPPSAGVMGYLDQHRDRLFWGQTYGAGDFGPDFLQRYGWCEFAGRRGPIASDTVAFGVLFLGPDTEYPSHAHQAEEIYVPLSGRALWQRGTEGWIHRDPLEVVHHPGWTPHAMRTQKDPLLALYMWRGGDLTQKSKIG